MKSKNILLVLLGLVCLALLCGVGYTVYQGKESQKEPAEEKDYQEEYLTYNGKKYKRNPDIYTVLFMGVDKEAQAEVGNQPGDAGQTDSLNLLVMNRETKEGKIIQISRDTVVDLDIYDTNNELLMTTEGQIALQYAFGDGKNRSCRLTGERVSELLGGIEVDSYIALSLDGLAAATDVIGGVTLTVPEDYTEIDPAFYAGAEVTLDGGMAEKYVRSRDVQSLDSNNQRMERQSQFMGALIQKMRNLSLEKEEYVSMYQEIEPYVTTNMTADELADLAEYKYAEDMLELPGEVTEKDGYAQFVVNAEEMKTILVKYFYKEV